MQFSCFLAFYAMVLFLQSLATESQKAKMKDLMEKAPVDEIDSKFRLFKQFDSVQDYSDHHFRNNKFVQESKVSCIHSLI